MKHITSTGSTIMASTGEDVGWSALQNKQQEDDGLKSLADAMLPHWHAS